MTRLATIIRWAITPSADPINRWCSIIALGAVLALVACVIGVEISR